ncbi:MAG: isoprenylcysteine carboxylmethyltransferase family protein [Lysobacterales bacterium]
MRLQLLVPPPVVAIVFVALVWGLSRYWPAPGLLPDGARLWLAGGLIALALILDLSALWAFRKAQTTVNPLSPERSRSIVRTGPYRVSRNPMYLGMALILTAWVVWRGQPLGLFLVAGFLAYLTVFQIKPEEAALAAKFGEPYGDYLRSVRRWL